MSGGWEERLGALEAEALGAGLELRHARSFSERRQGLAQLDALGPDVGLRIHRCSAVHTIGMRFSLDLLWLARDGHLLRVDRDVAPRRQRLCVRAGSVVEVTAGRADAFAAQLAAASSPGAARLPGVDTTSR